MSFRVFEGNVLSEDGWRMCNADECVWVTIPGTDVTIQVRSGVPQTILPAFAARFNQLVEPLRDPDTACWTLTNSVSTSNHPAGTAMDLNWNSHPFHVRGTYGDRLPALRQVLAEFRGCVWWGGDWTDPVDEMHLQLNYREGYLDNSGNFVLDVDQRLIDLANDLRAGYLGIYVPGSTPAPQPLSQQDRYAQLILAEADRLGITVRGKKIGLATGLVESNIKVYANSKVPASMSIPHDAVGTDGYSVGIFQQQVVDTGAGWWWGDAATCMDPTSSAGLFFTRLARLDYNNESHSPGSYAQAVQGSAFPDRYDERYAEAEALYNRLASTVELDEWEALVASNELYASRSIYRTSDDKTMSPLDALFGADATSHENWIEDKALSGDPWAISQVAAVATGQYPASKDQWAVDRARYVISVIQSRIAAQNGTK